MIKMIPAVESIMPVLTAYLACHTRGVVAIVELSSSIVVAATSIALIVPAIVVLDNVVGRRGNMNLRGMLLVA